MDATTNSLNWFEIPAKDIKRAKKFYESVFGIKLTMMELEDIVMAMFPMTPGSGKASGALAQSRMHKPSKSGSIIYLNANPDLNKSLAKVEKAGGKVIRSKTGIGENGFMAFFHDTEGNAVAMHSMK